MSPRREFYLPVLPEIRKIMIGRMAKPEEVLVVENDNGEVIREQFKVTLSIKFLVLILYFQGHGLDQSVQDNAWNVGLLDPLGSQGHRADYDAEIGASGKFH